LGADFERFPKPSVVRFVADRSATRTLRPRMPGIDPAIAAHPDRLLWRLPPPSSQSMGRGPLRAELPGSRCRRSRGRAGRLSFRTGTTAADSSSRFILSNMSSNSVVNGSCHGNAVAAGPLGGCRTGDVFALSSVKGQPTLVPFAGRRPVSWQSQADGLRSRAGAPLGVLRRFRAPYGQLLSRSCVPPHRRRRHR